MVFHVSELFEHASAVALAASPAGLCREPDHASVPMFALAPLGPTKKFAHSSSRAFAPPPSELEEEMSMGIKTDFKTASYESKQSEYSFLSIDNSNSCSPSTSTGPISDPGIEHCSPQEASQISHGIEKPSTERNLKSKVDAKIKAIKAKRKNNKHQQVA